LRRGELEITENIGVLLIRDEEALNKWNKMAMWRKDALIDFCRENRIKGYSKKRRSEIMKLILDSDLEIEDSEENHRLYGYNEWCKL
jgi:hypothetical protein